MRDRRRLIEEALHWHMLAIDADGHERPTLNDNADEQGTDGALAADDDGDAEATA